jgi:tetratricopeptide (TPR) repeat protein
VVSLAFLLVLLAPIQTTSSYASEWEQGKSALAQHDFAKAKRLFSSAAKANPNDPAIWFYLGIACGELNELDAAVANLERSRRLAPDRAEVDFNLALLYWRSGDIGKAKQAYRTGLALSPNDPAALQNYASLLIKTGENEKAVAPLLALKNVSGLALPARVSLIECYLKTDNREAAEHELDDLLRSSLAGPAEQTKLAAVLIENNDLPAAERVLRSSIQADPAQPKAYAALGLVLLNQKHYKEAADSFESAFHLEPASAEYAMAFANALVLWNRPNTLLAFLDSVRSQFGSLPEFQHKLAFAYYGVAEFSNAIATLQNLLRADPPRQDQIYFLLGESYFGMGQFKESEAAFCKAIELNPKDPMYYESYAALLQKQGPNRLDDAIAELQKASELNSSDPGLLLQLGLCYESKGDLVESLHLLKKAVKGVPDSLPAHVALARLYFKLGRRPEGQEEKKTIAQLETKLQQEKLTR